jgi:hypothetical protein
LADPNRLSCCGISELADIRDDDTPEQSIMAIDATEQGLIIFSDVREYNPGYRKGKALAKLITDQGLGTIVEVPPATNPNTQNHIKAWLWNINKRKLKSYQAKLRKSNPEAYDYGYDPYNYTNELTW